MTNPLSETQKQELARLAEAATPRPWHIRQPDDSVKPRIFISTPTIDEGSQGGKFYIAFMPDYALTEVPDAAYIVAACNAVPALLTEIDELKAGLRLAGVPLLPDAQLAIAIAALERIKEMPSDLQYCRDEPNPERCPTCCAREALRKLRK